jgi:hypothetical protein
MAPPPWKLDLERIIETVQSAPSIFDSRPWLPDPLLVPVAENRIELRAKPGVLQKEGQEESAWLHTDKGIYFDPLAREFAISCGAALFNLRLAIRVAGHDLSVWLLPDRLPVSTLPAPGGTWPPPESTLLASVEIVTTRIKRPTVEEQELYEAIWRRHTNRWPYKIVPAPLPIIAAMEDAAAQEGARLRLLHKCQAKKWMRLAGEADKDLKRDPAEWPSKTRERFRRFREERNLFMTKFRNSPNSNFGPANERNFPWTKETSYRRTREDFWIPDDKERFEHKRKVQLMALSTQDDQLLDWLRTGQALQRAILTATRYSVSAPYGVAAEYHAPRWYGVPGRGRVILRDKLARYGLSVSFLTEPLECYDIDHPLLLENIHDKPRRWPWLRPRRRPWESPEPRHWPWRWQFPELPQMVLRVGYPTEPADAAQQHHPDRTHGNPGPARLPGAAVRSASQSRQPPR